MVPASGSFQSGGQDGLQYFTLLLVQLQAEVRAVE